MVKKNFTDIHFPNPPIVDKHGEMTPFSFYSQVISLSKNIQFMLGYFSTNAISRLSAGFAKFIYNNGKAEFIINQFLQSYDYNLLANKDKLSQTEIVFIESHYINDLESLHETLKELSDHFFNCLRYLLVNERLKIIPVTCSDGTMSHYKEAIFTDFEGNKIYINGSCNFTKAGLVDNGESFVVTQSWINEKDSTLINSRESYYNKVFAKRAQDEFIYLEIEKLRKFIINNSEEKDIYDLLNDEHLIRQKHLLNERFKNEEKKQEEELLAEIEEIRFKPRFPYEKPHDYQDAALTKWKENGNNGLFAMATGTGKTVTALLCVLDKYYTTNKYNVIITVPSQALLHQWKKECQENFNFINVLTSKDNDWQNILKRHIFTSDNLIFITTYAAISQGRSLQKIFNEHKKELSDYILIADECHNIGSESLIKKFPRFFKEKIGLSATPERIYDEFGTCEIADLFQAKAPCYTFSYSMKKAIEKKDLCEFNYYPRFLFLNDEELIQYLKITKKIVPHIDGMGRPRDEYAKRLLIERKRIINKAQNKANLFREIISEIIHSSSLPPFEFAFVYVPEGKEPDYSTVDHTDIEEEEIRLVDIYKSILGEEYNFKVKTFLGETPNKEFLIEMFREGNFNALLAMKCLDEGVDVPRTQFAIFCSSTGNPRQFIQRRGRVLRKHEDKEVAYIFDMIVKPDLQRVSLYSDHDDMILNTEINIFRNEILRAVNFAALAKNRFELITGELNDICLEFDISLSLKINEELNRYKLCENA